MEIRDLYDKNKRLTGKTIKKGEKIPKGSYILVVLVMIKNSKGEFLIQKRADEENLYGATGGHCKSGENGLMGAITETREEIGVDLKPEELTLLFDGRQDDTQVFYEVFYTQKDLDINKLNLQKEEVVSVEWMDARKIKNLSDKSQFLEYHIDEIFKAIEMIDKDKSKKSKNKKYENDNER